MAAGLVCVGILLGFGAQAQEGPLAQEEEREGEAAEVRQDPDDDAGWWRGPWGMAEPTRMYTGLWALHFTRLHDGFSFHQGVGVNYRGITANTFVNTEGDRTWTLGLARSVVKVEGSDAAVSLGYRAGIVRGYDERLHELAGRWPAIPGAEVTVTFRVWRVGAQITWAGLVASLGGFVQP